jgi:hypothetical protein
MGKEKIANSKCAARYTLSGNIKNMLGIQRNRSLKLILCRKPRRRLEGQLLDNN